MTHVVVERLLNQEEIAKALKDIHKDPSVWDRANSWCAQNGYPYFIKPKENSCVPLIAGKEPPYVHTDFYVEFPEVVALITTRYANLSRINIQKIAPNAAYEWHIDGGAYFTTCTRRVLCLQGDYRFGVGESIYNAEVVDVSPGDLVTFNNQLFHKAVNKSPFDRIAIVFDTLGATKWPK